MKKKSYKIQSVRHVLPMFIATISKAFLLFMFFPLICFQTLNTYAQNCLVFNNNTYMVLDDSCNLVIDNNASNAITLLGTGGNIISESEFNRVKWNIGTAIGTYSVPFTKSPENKIPFSINISTAGTETENGYILFSTYGGSWDNELYMPSDVNNMFGENSVNNSAYVIDRFWIVDALNYTTKPAASFSFTYLDSEWSAASNTIIEANLGAQRYNSTNTTWSGYLPQGVINTASKTLSSVPVAPPDFFRSWTLADNSTPLPISLLRFTAQCNTTERGLKEVYLHWQTASETNNDYFVIEKSTDAINWLEIASIKGAGNSNAILDYYYHDQLSTPDTSAGLARSFESSIVYYRLKQTDFNGDFSYSDIIQLSCQNDFQNNLIEIISIYPNPASNNLNYDIISTQNREIVISIINVLGQNIIRENKYLKEGLNKYLLDVSALTKGVYCFKIETVDRQYKDSKQILIK